MWRLGPYGLKDRLVFSIVAHTEGIQKIKRTPRQFIIQNTYSLNRNCHFPLDLLKTNEVDLLVC